LILTDGRDGNPTLTIAQAVNYPGEIFFGALAPFLGWQEYFEAITDPENIYYAETIDGVMDLNAEDFITTVETAARGLTMWLRFLAGPNVASLSPATMVAGNLMETTPVNVPFQNSATQTIVFTLHEQVYSLLASGIQLMVQGEELSVIDLPYEWWASLDCPEVEVTIEPTEVPTVEATAEATEVATADAGGGGGSTGGYQNELEDLFGEDIDNDGEITTDCRSVFAYSYTHGTSVYVNGSQVVDNVQGTEATLSQTGVMMTTKLPNGNFLQSVLGMPNGEVSDLSLALATNDGMAGLTLDGRVRDPQGNIREETGVAIDWTEAHGVQAGATQLSWSFSATKAAYQNGSNVDVMADVQQTYPGSLIGFMGEWLLLSANGSISLVDVAAQQVYTYGIAGESLVDAALDGCGSIVLLGESGNMFIISVMDIASFTIAGVTTTVQPNLVRTPLATSVSSVAGRNHS
jgi:hypothetical protein